MKISPNSSTYALSNQAQGHGDFEIFFHLLQCKLSSPISQLYQLYLAHDKKL